MEKLSTIVVRNKKNNLNNKKIGAGDLGLPLPINALELHHTQRQQDEILD